MLHAHDQRCDIIPPARGERRVHKRTRGMRGSAAEQGSDGVILEHIRQPVAAEQQRIALLERLLRGRARKLYSAPAG